MKKTLSLFLSLLFVLALAAPAAAAGKMPATAYFTSEQEILAARPSMNISTSDYGVTVTLDADLPAGTKASLYYYDGTGEMQSENITMKRVSSTIDFETFSGWKQNDYISVDIDTPKDAYKWTVSTSEGDMTYNRISLEYTSASYGTSSYMYLRSDDAFFSKIGFNGNGHSSYEITVYDGGKKSYDFSVYDDDIDDISAVYLYENGSYKGYLSKYNGDDLSQYIYYAKQHPFKIGSYGSDSGYTPYVPIQNDPVPTAPPSNGSGLTVNFGGFSGANSITVFRSGSGNRDGSWNRLGEINASSYSFTDNNPSSNEPYYKVHAKYSNGSEDLIFRNSTKLEMWKYDNSEKVTSGYDYQDSISYEYIYERGIFSYRKMTYENLEYGKDYSFDNYTTKISSRNTVSTVPAITLSRTYENVIAMSFYFQITKLTKGSPFGLWCLYVRLPANKNWKVATNFQVSDGNQVTLTNKKLDSTFSMDKVAFVPPRLRTDTSFSFDGGLTSITVKDSNY